jgi:carotenoid cleavage dioxygenase
MFGCPQDYFDIALEKDHPFFEDENFRIKLAKFTFNMVTGEADMKYVVDHLSLEFPIINQQYIGKKNRYAWIGYLFQTMPADKVGQENLYFQGFVKYDMVEEKIVKKMDFGPTKTSGEVFFSPRDNATEEDDGYAMAFVYDWKTQKTEFTMWDAKTMEETPVVTAETMIRVPNGFHSYFIPQNQLP